MQSVTSWSTLLLLGGQNLDGNFTKFVERQIYPTAKTANYTAMAGDLVVCDTTGMGDQRGATRPLLSIVDLVVEAHLCDPSVAVAGRSSFS